MPRFLLRFTPAAALLAATLTAAQAPILVTVDASHAPLQIIHTTMVLPVEPGPLTLYYPKWIPGEHEPDGPIGNVVSLRFTARGQVIPWSRDTLDAFTFHLTVPAGVSTLTARFDYIEGSTGEYTVGSSATDKLVDINWNQNLLYPAGTPAKQQRFTARLILPPGWRFGTALRIRRRAGGAVDFRTTTLNRLVDSPVIAGQYYRAIDLTPPGEPIHHEIDIVADAPEDLNMSPAVVAGLTNLVAQTGRLFGSRHYRDYHFLLILSDHVAHFGLEHHESDDSRLPERVLISPGAAYEVGYLLPHEFVHSWNGKFRRPADLASPPYQAPMQDDLLWVYEGLTDFLGNLEATRSGLWTRREYRHYLAGIAAELGPGRPGRTWRPLIDTAVAVPGMFENGRRSWSNWRRNTDYYEEGNLLWLEVATIIHDRSHGGKSLEDFLHLFYGGSNRGPQLKTYTRNDLVAALNQVVPYDWAAFFRRRLTSLAPQPPLKGVEAGGWHFEMASPGAADAGSLRYSIGLSVGSDGKVDDSIVNGPAYRAGIVPGMQVIGVDGRLYTRKRLDDAVIQSPANKQPIALLIVNDDYYRTCLIDYHGGAKAPRLVRDDSRPDYLDRFLQPLAPRP
jgi:predicted metalloprotease with PDZ domain